MSSIKKTPGAGSAFKNAQVADAAQAETAKTPTLPITAKDVQKQAVAEFAQRTAQDPALGQVAAQMGQDGKLVDADGNALSGSALLQARLDAMKQSVETPPRPAVNPFPDTGEPVIATPPRPAVNPFPDTGATEPLVAEPPRPAVNPFPDTGVTVEPEPVTPEPTTTEPAEPTVNPFPEPTPSPGPTIAINPIPDGRRLGGGDDDES